MEFKQDMYLHRGYGSEVTNFRQRVLQTSDNV